MITSFKSLGQEGGSGSGYTLPVASQTTLGGIKVGQNLTIDSGGTLSADAQAVSVATTATTGVVQVGSGLSITSGGVLSTDIDLSNYVTQDELSGYVETSAMSGYVETNAMSGYATTDSLSAYTPSSAMSDYLTVSDYRDDVDDVLENGTKSLYADDDPVGLVVRYNDGVEKAKVFKVTSGGTSVDDYTYVQPSKNTKSPQPEGWVVGKSEQIATIDRSTFSQPAIVIDGTESKFGYMDKDVAHFLVVHGDGIFDEWYDKTEDPETGEITWNSRGLEPIGGGNTGVRYYDAQLFPYIAGLYIDNGKDTFSGEFIEQNYYNYTTETEGQAVAFKYCQMFDDGVSEDDGIYAFRVFDTDDNGYALAFRPRCSREDCSVWMEYGKVENETVEEWNQLEGGDEITVYFGDDNNNLKAPVGVPFTFKFEQDDLLGTMVVSFPKEQGDFGWEESVDITEYYCHEKRVNDMYGEPAFDSWFANEPFHNMLYNGSGRLQNGNSYLIYNDDEYSISLGDDDASYFNMSDIYLADGVHLFSSYYEIDNGGEKGGGAKAPAPSISIYRDVDDLVVDFGSDNYSYSYHDGMSIGVDSEGYVTIDGSQEDQLSSDPIRFFNMQLFNYGDGDYCEFSDIQYGLYSDGVEYDLRPVMRYKDGEQGFDCVLTCNFARTIYNTAQDNSLPVYIFSEDLYRLERLEQAIEDLQNANAGE